MGIVVQVFVFLFSFVSSVQAAVLNLGPGQDEWSSPYTLVSKEFTPEEIKTLCAKTYSEYVGDQINLHCTVTFTPTTWDDPLPINPLSYSPVLKNLDDLFFSDANSMNFFWSIPSSEPLAKNWEGSKSGIPLLEKLIDQHLGSQKVTQYLSIPQKLADEWTAKKVSFKTLGQQGFRKSSFSFSWKDCAKSYQRKYYGESDYPKIYFNEACSVKTPELKGWQTWENNVESSRFAIQVESSDDLILLPPELVDTKPWGPQKEYYGENIPWAMYLHNPSYEGQRRTELAFYPDGRPGCGTGMKFRKATVSENKPSPLFKLAFKEIKKRFTEQSLLHGYVSDVVRSGKNFDYQNYLVKRTYEIDTKYCGISVSKYYGGKEKLTCKVNFGTNRDFYGPFLVKKYSKYFELPNDGSLSVSASDSGYEISLVGKGFSQLTEEAQWRNLIEASLREKLGNDFKLSILVNFRKSLH